MGSSSVAITSDIKRKKWIRDGLVQAASSSFWGPYTGKNNKSIVYQENNEDAKAGHTVVFDYSGKISSKAIKGKDTAYGKGEIKRIFSDKITVERYRIPVNNGDKFDGVDIGDLSINEHSNSRSLLSDLFIRWKDQMIFDSAQGSVGTVSAVKPTHIYSLGATFTINQLTLLEQAIKTGQGFKTSSATGAVTTTAAARRAPLEPFTLKDGQKVWLFLIDSYMAGKLRTNSTYQSLLQSADVRGNDNRLISGVIGRLGRLLIVEASDFFGSTDGAGTFGLDDSEIEIAGLRKYLHDGTIDTTTPLSAWEGQSGFSYATAANICSRGVVLGQGAVQTAFGKMPDYKYQPSTDFAIDSESAVEFWTEVKKTKLTLEGGGVYKQAKISGIDFGVISVDLVHA